jgi:hypothetical protein
MPPPRIANPRAIVARGEHLLPSSSPYFRQEPSKSHSAMQCPPQPEIWMLKRRGSRVKHSNFQQLLPTRKMGIFSKQHKVIDVHDIHGTAQNPLNKTTMWSNKKAIFFCFVVTSGMFQFGFDYGIKNSYAAN